MREPYKGASRSRKTRVKESAMSEKEKEILKGLLKNGELSETELEGVAGGDCQSCQTCQTCETCQTGQKPAIE
jgi:hypothetical protein